MKVLMGVDPHKGSVAVAALDEFAGGLVERASFPQSRAGLRTLERWAIRFGERCWGVENAGGPKVGTWRGGSAVPQEARLRCRLQEPSGRFAGTLAQRRLTKRSRESLFPRRWVIKGELATQ
jgi:hypothetical protein